MPTLHGGLVGVTHPLDTRDELGRIDAGAHLVVTDDVADRHLGIRDDGQPGCHVVVELVGAHALVEDRLRGDGVQADVTGREDAHQLGLGYLVVELDVRQSQLLHLVDGPLLASSSADEEEVDVREATGRVDDEVQPDVVGMGAGEHRGESLDAELLAQVLAGLVDLVLGQVGAIGDDGDLVDVDAELAEVVLPAFRHDDDLAGTGVDGLFQPLEHLVEGRSLFEGAAGD